MLGEGPRRESEGAGAGILGGHDGVGVQRLIGAYPTRWRLEDTIRFIKQNYDLENIRVMTYRRLQNMAALALAAAYFVAAHIGYGPKLKILALHSLTAAKRIFGIPDFRYYAISDAIKQILSRTGQGILHPKNEEGGRSYSTCPFPDLIFWGNSWKVFFPFLH